MEKFRSTIRTLNPVDSLKREKLVLAAKRCIDATFHEQKWEELAYLTSSRDIIYGHPRLMRSLSFNDDDYSSCIFDVLELLLLNDESNLQKIIEYIDLKDWLHNNDPKLYSEVFGPLHSCLETAEQTAIANSFDLTRHITRLQKAIDEDPELAIGSTKEMLETVLKTILIEMGEAVGREDLPDLSKRACNKLRLDPRDIDDSAKGAQTIKRILSSLGQVIGGINELRNHYGTGHGKTRSSAISAKHARLAVGAGAAMATFLMETYEYRKKTP